ncbi:fatty acyl-CoA hydrolase precursor, medium chain-like [Styela clava]
MGITMSSDIVSMPNGKIKGKAVKLKGKNAARVSVFRNIPFAKPPVGNLRFMPPQPVEPWNGVKDGTIPGKVPMYPTAMEEGMEQYFPFPNSYKTEPVLGEDCLHLSVYTPSLQKGKNLAVMVWIYGGGFSSGSEREYDGTVLAGMNDVVVVVPNYRVGVFGFLSLGPSSVCSGNAGILDQQLALRWVQENIQHFGGDKNNVTIIGESAGAVSVNHHLISPLSRGLFHKAISQSGQSTMRGVFRGAEKNAEYNKQFFEQLKITEEDDNKILEALQKVPADDLVEAMMSLMESGESFCPCFDGKVFPKTPEEVLKNKDFTKVPYIIGCNNTEGQGLLSIMSSPNYMKGITEEELGQVFYIPVSEEGFEKCKDFYIKDESDEKRFSKMFGAVMGDDLFVSKAVQTASVYSDSGSQIYLYYATFQLKMFQDNVYGEEVGKMPEWCFCDHSNDIMMTFGVPFSPHPLSIKAKFSKEEEEISRKFMAYLTNFAKTGDPNKGKPVDKEWPQYKAKGDHLVVGSTFSVEKNLAEKEVDFWNNVMPAYMTDKK